LASTWCFLTLSTHTTTGTLLGSGKTTEVYQKYQNPIRNTSSLMSFAQKISRRRRFNSRIGSSLSTRLKNSSLHRSSWRMQPLHPTIYNRPTSPPTSRRRSRRILSSSRRKRKTGRKEPQAKKAGTTRPDISLYKTNRQTTSK
jgi:hypothetical protein